MRRYWKPALGILIALAVGWLAHGFATTYRDSANHPPVPVGTRGGVPSVRVVIASKHFSDEQWPYDAEQIIVEGTIEGLCLVEVNGIAYAINGAAANAGYPFAEPPLRRLHSNQETCPGCMIDESPVRDIALQLVAQLRTQWPEAKPFAGNPILDP